MHQAFPVDESFDSATGVVETAEQYLKSVRDQRRAVPATVSAKVPGAYKTAADARRSIDPAWSGAIAHQQRPSDGGDDRMTRWMPWLGDQWCRWRSAACAPSDDDVDLDGARDYFDFLYPAVIEASDLNLNDAVDENAEYVEKEGCDRDVTLDDENGSHTAVEITQGTGFWERIAAMTQPQLLRALELHQSWIALPSHLTPQHCHVLFACLLRLDPVMTADEMATVRLFAKHLMRLRAQTEVRPSSHVFTRQPCSHLWLQLCVLIHFISVGFRQKDLQ